MELLCCLLILEMNPIPVSHCLSLDINVKLDVDIEIKHLNIFMDIGQSWEILFY